VSDHLGFEGLGVLGISARLGIAVEFVELFMSEGNSQGTSLSYDRSSGFISVSCATENRLDEYGASFMITSSFYCLFQRYISSSGCSLPTSLSKFEASFMVSFLFHCSF
jgi:hypothetical protein